MQQNNRVTGRRIRAVAACGPGRGPPAPGYGCCTARLPQTSTSSNPHPGQTDNRMTRAVESKGHPTHETAHADSA